MNKLLLQICKRIEKTNPNCISYAYKDCNWWMVAVDDYEFYRSDCLKSIRENWSKVFNKKKEKLVFCYRKPNEKLLQELMNNNNLIMNV